MVDKKTVKIRIAVAVDHKGNWGAHGWGKIEHFNDLSKEDNEASMMEVAVDDLKDREARYWVTATLDIPENKEIEAEGVESVEDEEIPNGILIGNTLYSFGE